MTIKHKYKCGYYVTDKLITPTSNLVQPIYTYPINDKLLNTLTDIERIVDMLNGIKIGVANLDPIKLLPSKFENIDRINAPQKCLFLYFDSDDIKFYEEDANGTRQLRMTINYDRVNLIQAIHNNKLLTTAEAEALNLLAELRNTQAALYEQSQVVNNLKFNPVFEKDEQLKQLKTENKTLLDHLVSFSESITSQERIINEQKDLIERQKSLINKQETELQTIKQQIIDRQRKIDHLEID
jgi:hypothetical protein